MLARMCILCPGATVGVEDEGCSMAGMHTVPLFGNLYLGAPCLAAWDQWLGEVHLEMLSSLVCGDSAKVILMRGRS